MSVASGLGGAFWGRALVAVEWRKLCFVTYAIEPSALATHVPPGVTLETRDGRAQVSLVLWQAKYPEVFGVSLPGDTTATEAALRYFVREGPRRGAVTLFEDSSSPFATLAARALFREPTRHSTLHSKVEQGSELLCRYDIAREGDHAVSVRAREPARPTDHQAAAYPIVQRPYGYASSNRGGLLRYDLDHPVWDTYEVLDCEVRVDFAALYGSPWGFLSGVRPESVVLAEGSQVRASLPE
ncbi:MAG: DUF2071 domain-containing protein [Polyangiales bacterium]